MQVKGQQKHTETAFLLRKEIQYSSSNVFFPALCGEILDYNLATWTHDHLTTLLLGMECWLLEQRYN